MRLTLEQQRLLNTNFGPEMEKNAHEIVEMEKVATDCLSYGYDLAMQKIAEMEEEAAKGDEKEEKKEGEEEKTASAMGEIILDAYWQTMMEKGAEFYGDPDIYINKLAEDPGVVKKTLDLLNPMKYKEHAKGMFAPGNLGAGGRAKAIGKGLVLPGAIAGAAYGGKKLYDRMKKKKEEAAAQTY